MNSSDLRQELAHIERHVTRMWDEVPALQPNHMRREGIDTAGTELGVIVDETEAAAHAIITAAESLLTARFDTAEEHQAHNRVQAIAILEACSFQDITGQRVSKVAGVLRQISERIARLADALGVVDADQPQGVSSALPLDGPALPADHPERTTSAVSQAELDDLFD